MNDFESTQVYLLGLAQLLISQAQPSSLGTKLAFRLDAR